MDPFDLRGGLLLIWAARSLITCSHSYYVPAFTERPCGRRCSGNVRVPIPAPGPGITASDCLRATAAGVRRFAVFECARFIFRSEPIPVLPRFNARVEERS